jgi:hypothetical protein
MKTQKLSLRRPGCSSAQACAAMAERSHRRKPRKADRPNDSVDQTRIWVRFPCHFQSKFSKNQT